MSRELSYHEARTRALHRELDANPDIVLLGGAVGLPFNPDDRLGERHGERIIWPPISEFATTGIGVGAAMAGLRPLVPLSTSSFMFYGWAPVVLEAPNVRYLTGGKVSAPVAFHVMAGSRRGGGAQHEHTPQAMLQNVPGLRVYAPGTPAGVDAVVHAALTGPDPCVIVDHVLLADAVGPVPDAPGTVEPMLARRGSRVVVVAYSALLQRALAAARALEEEGLDVAVLDVPALHPAPIDAVLRELDGYEVGVFVDESRAPGSPASHLMARALEAGALSRARLVASVDAPAPFALGLLDEVVPTTQRIAGAVRAAAG